MSSLFNPKTGVFRDDIRIDKGEAYDDELRQSLKSFGWRAEFPAIEDENGVILVGHRRMRLAKELGITPCIQKLTFGTDEDADNQRMQTALASNLGGAPLSKASRQYIARQLCNDDWTIERIAERLGTSKSTIARDLEGFSQSGKTFRPKGGRPKGPPRRLEFAADKAPEIARGVLDEGKGHQEVRKAAGVSDTVVRRVVEREKGRREAIQKMEADIEASLGAADEKRLEIAMAKRARKQDQEFEARVDEKVAAEVDEYMVQVLPDLQKERLMHQEAIKGRPGHMTKKDYRKIWTCLHPDTITDPALKARFTEAFQIFTRTEKFFLNEEASPTRFAPPLPRTPAGWRVQKRKIDEQRRQERQRKRNGKDMPVNTGT